VFVKHLRMVLQISGIECIVLGFMSWMAALSIQHLKTTDERAYEEALNFLVTLADLTRTLTHAPPYVGLTGLGILLVGLGTALSEYDPRS
jgi:hypothetical protein